MLGRQFIEKYREGKRDSKFHNEISTEVSVDLI